MTASSPPIEILRFTTAGSVDDGKSTLIGRLLYDSKSLMEDQLEALQRSADITGEGTINLANLTDGLRAEREQGITIDVAYRYFATAKRKFIIADCPGHVQYTRNMVTGASTANLALILVDARKGVIEQSKRHSYLASLLKIPHLVVCVNKMDLVGYAEARFEEIREQFMSFVPRLDIRDVTFIPISALAGDNVVDPSPHMPWYRGPTLLGELENVYIASDLNLKDFRFPVQYVIRPYKDEYHDFRGFAGQIAGGTVRVGDEVLVLPSGRTTRVKEIHTYEGSLDEAFAPMCVTLRLDDEIDISRGDLIAGIYNPPHVQTEHEANLCWMAETPLQLGRKYAIKHNTNTQRMIATELLYKVNIHTLENEPGASTLGLNDIGRVRFKTTKPLVYDNYRKSRGTGSFILIDEATNATVAAGMLHSPTPESLRPEYDGPTI
jgi:bifunctional enzyme CysN/CysC/sulfate adenylyltransferase subunit 1